MCDETHNIIEVDRVSYRSQKIKALQIFNARVPFVLNDFDCGPCTSSWLDAEYLYSRAGEKHVTVHVTTNQQMDFISKNFLYKTLPMQTLLRRCMEDVHEDFYIANDEKYYLRSLAEDQRKGVASLETDFPELWKDCRLPELIPPDRLFSTVLRVASKGIRVWTHYDVMDNFLIQVVNTKSVLLFPPSDLPFLYLKGDKSRVLDVNTIEQDQFPLFQQAHRYQCKLQPGDALFIPAFWFHNTYAEDFSISVNAFWKNLPDPMYDAKDVYGNRDLMPAQRAFQSFQRSMLPALKELGKESPEIRQFYALRIIEELKAVAAIDDDDDD